MSMKNPLTPDGIPICNHCATAVPGRTGGGFNMKSGGTYSKR